MSNNLKTWFGDSKVTKNGKPLKVYHGTSKNIKDFQHQTKLYKESLDAFYFTDDPKIASDYANKAQELIDDNDMNDSFANILPCYLKIENPFYYRSTNQGISDANKYFTITTVSLHGKNDYYIEDQINGILLGNPPNKIKELYDKYQKLLDDPKLDFTEFANIHNEYTELFDTKIYHQNDALEFLKSLGYDGIIINSNKSNITFYLCFYKYQIKSVFNKGTYDINKSISESSDTKRDNFNNWFKKSKITKNGKPLKLYHGTTNDFKSFSTLYDINKAEFANLGIFFTNDIDEAQAYATDNGAIIPVYLKMEKPYTVEIDVEDNKESIEFYNDEINRLKELLKIDKSVKSQLNKVQEELNSLDFLEIRQLAKEVNNQGARKIKRDFISDGYDGLIIEIPDNKGNPSEIIYYVVFEPNQVKSVYNNGSYSNNDNISENYSVNLNG